MDKDSLISYIYCGESGVGKTTFVKKSWEKHILINCKNNIKYYSTLESLIFSLNSIFKSDEKINKDNLDIYIEKAISEGYILIIDEAEKQEESLLEYVVNSAILCKAKEIVFCFDMDYNNLYSSVIFKKLIDWNIVKNKISTNYQAEYNDFSYEIKERIPNADLNLVEEIIQLSDFNFNKMKRLVWLIDQQQSQFKEIEKSVYIEYSSSIVKEKLDQLPEELVDVLKKSSIIGEMFQRNILESPNGFCVTGVKTYLSKLEATKYFIQVHLQEDHYRFISGSIHLGIIESMECWEKIEAQQILLKYYENQLDEKKQNGFNIHYLKQMKQISYELNNYEYMFFCDKKLLFLYIKTNDMLEMRKILTDLLISSQKFISDKTWLLYLSYYKIKSETILGYPKEALEQIEIVEQNSTDHINFELHYLCAYNLYNTGKVDEAYEKTKNMIEYFKQPNNQSQQYQRISSLFYSLLATIQHHFGIEDFGIGYYKIALNRSQFLSHKDLYYKILAKCDMYFEYSTSSGYLKKCIQFFEERGATFNLAECYTNLATETMFNSTSDIEMVDKYFEKAICLSSRTPNQKLAYVLNNYAIFQILHKQDYREALSNLNRSLLVNLSNFTYMTIYLNIAICHLKLNGLKNREFMDSYKNFSDHYFALKKRENTTQYEDMYKNILDILILEYNGEKEKAINKAASLLNNYSNIYFKPILEDIISRNNHEQKKSIYSKNCNLYSFFKKNSIFLAEFRFWE